MKRIFTLFLALALALSLAMPALAAPVTFTDIDGHWASAAITRMAELGVVNGKGGGKFDPEGNVTYAEFTKMVVAQFYKDKLGETKGANPWYTPYIDVANAAGILTGVALDATAAINRYDMAQVMFNVMKDKGMATDKLEDTSKIGDWSSIPEGYQEAVSVCYNAKMLKGISGNFAGANNMTRAQAAEVLTRLIDAGEATTSTPPASTGIPEGATPLTGDMLQESLLTTYHPEDGTFVMYTDGMDFRAGSQIKFQNDGYSTLTFTVTSNLGNQTVSCSCMDTFMGTRLAGALLQEGDVQTFTADITGCKLINIYASRGMAADAVITNAYLTK